MKVEGAFVHCLLKEPIFDTLVSLQKWHNNLPLLLISPAEQMESSSLAASRPFPINPTLFESLSTSSPENIPNVKGGGVKRSLTFYTKRGDATCWLTYQKWKYTFISVSSLPASQFRSSSVASSRPFPIISPSPRPLSRFKWFEITSANNGQLNNYNLRPTVSLPTCKTHGNCSQGSSDNYSSFDCERSKSRHQVQQFWHYHSAHLGSVKSVTVDHFFEKREPGNLPECSVSSFPAPWLKSSSTSSSGSIRIPKWTRTSFKWSLDSSLDSSRASLYFCSKACDFTTPCQAIPTRKSCQLLSLGALDQSM